MTSTISTGRRLVLLGILAAVLSAALSVALAGTARGSLPQCSSHGAAHIKKCAAPVPPPAPYAVRDAAIIGQSPVTGTLTITCRSGYFLTGISVSGYNPTPTNETVGTITSSIPDNSFVPGVSGSTFVTYTLNPDAPAGNGVELTGTCVPTAA